MTPCINRAKKSKIVYTVHEYVHDASNESYGLEAAEKLAIDGTKIFKTLVVRLDNKELVVAVIPVSSMLSMKHIATSMAAKKAVMATKVDVERSTGYVLGGVSPLGQKKALKTVIDLSAKNHATILVSAGRRGLEIELNPNDLRQLVNGEFYSLCQ